jgi:tetratricopeptide (TPR) repeat protein
VESLLDQRKLVTLEVEIESAAERGLPAGELTWARARLAASRGDVDGGIVILDEALTRDGEAPDLLRLKCQLLYEHSTPDRAVEALEQLCRRCPEDGAAWHNLGTAYQKAGCAALAVQSYQKSLAVRPNSVATLLQLGHAQHSLGRMQAAKRAWQAAKEVAPGDLAIDAALALVDQPAQVAVPG